MAVNIKHILNKYKDMRIQVILALSSFKHLPLPLVSAGVTSFVYDDIHEVKA